MLKTDPKPPFQSPESALNFSLSPQDLEQYFEYYLSVYCYTQAKKTIASKRETLSVLLQFLSYKGKEKCGRMELVEFFRHVQFGHEEPLGRYGKGNLSSSYLKPVRPRTIQLYHDYLKGFFRALTQEGLIPHSPMEGLPRPSSPLEDIVPFTPEQFIALLDAAQDSVWPERDLAIYWLIFDVGLRRSEVANLRRQDIDLKNHTITLVGKRDKKRLCMFGEESGRHLVTYLTHIRYMGLNDSEKIFRCSRNRDKPLSAEGIYRMFVRHGKAAGLQNVRCSPHTLRHTFATEFMMSGANQKATMRQLGHDDTKTTLRYQHVVESRLASVHRAHSPGDKLRQSYAQHKAQKISKVLAPLSGGRPRQPIESFPCTCGLCPEKPKKACRRGNVLIKRAARERARLKKMQN